MQQRTWTASSGPNNIRSSVQTFKSNLILPFGDVKLSFKQAGKYYTQAVGHALSLAMISHFWILMLKMTQFNLGKLTGLCSLVEFIPNCSATPAPRYWFQASTALSYFFTSCLPLWFALRMQVQVCCSDKPGLVFCRSFIHRRNPSKKNQIQLGRFCSNTIYELRSI